MRANGPDGTAVGSWWNEAIKLVGQRHFVRLATAHLLVPCQLASIIPNFGWHEIC